MKHESFKQFVYFNNKTHFNISIEVQEMKNNNNMGIYA